MLNFFLFNNISGVTYMLFDSSWTAGFKKVALFSQVRSLKMKILPSLSSDSMGTGSSAKPQFRLYITVATAVFQPIIIYWLTSHLIRWPRGVYLTWSPSVLDPKMWLWSVHLPLYALLWVNSCSVELQRVLSSSDGRVCNPMVSLI